MPVIKINVKIDLSYEVNSNATVTVVDQNEETIVDCDTVDDAESIMEEMIGEALEEAGLLPHQIDYEWSPI